MKTHKEFIKKFDWFTDDKFDVQLKRLTQKIQDLFRVNLCT